MGRVEKTIFISYRRTDVAWAQLIHEELRRRGYDVFLDFSSTGIGDFEDVILANIRERAYFLVLLTASAFERCGDPADLFRREIETALDTQRHIVPIMLEGFAFKQTDLPPELAQLKRYSGLDVHQTYIEAALNRLCEHFLGGPPNTPSQAESLLTDLTGPLSEFYVDEPGVALRSNHYYRFACAPHAPHDDSALRRLISGKDEKQFSHCIRQVFGAPPPQEPPRRSATLTTFSCEGHGRFLDQQRIAVTMKGALGFVTLACLRDEAGHLMFAPAEFLYSLCCFWGFAARFYRNDGYRGDCLLNVALEIPERARVVESTATPRPLNARRLFTDPLYIVAKGSYFWAGNINLHGQELGEELLNTVDEVMLAVARENGNLLGSTFREEVQPLIDDALARVTSA